jgi:hypothetical protein
MGTDDQTTPQRRSWRQRLGLAEQPPNQNAWVVLASAQVDDAERGYSEPIERVEQALRTAEIDVQVRPYVGPDGAGTIPAVIGTWSARSVEDRIRIVVLVRLRDLERAETVAGGIQHVRLEWHTEPQGSAFTDEELTRLSLGTNDDRAPEPDVDA